MLSMGLPLQLLIHEGEQGDGFDGAIFLGGGEGGHQGFFHGGSFAC